MNVVLQCFHVRAGIDKVYASADFIGTIEGIYDLRHIHQTDHDTVILLNAGSSQCPGRLINVLEHLTEGDFLVEIIQRDLIRIVFVDIIDELIHGKTLWRLRTNCGVIHKVFLPGHIIYRFVLNAVLIEFFPRPVYGRITGFCCFTHNGPPTRLIL